MVVARDLQERIGFYELGRNEGSFNRLAARWAATTARQRLLTERLLRRE